MGYRSDSGVLRMAALPDGSDAPSEPAPLADAVRREGLRFALVAGRGTEPWRPLARLRMPAYARARAEGRPERR